VKGILTGLTEEYVSNLLHFHVEEGTRSACWEKSTSQHKLSF